MVRNCWWPKITTDQNPEEQRSTRLKNEPPHRQLGAENVPTRGKISMASPLEGERGVRALLRGARRCPRLEKHKHSGHVNTAMWLHAHRSTLEISSEVGGGLTRGDSPRHIAELTGAANCHEPAVGVSPTTPSSSRPLPMLGTA